MSILEHKYLLVMCNLLCTTKTITMSKVLPINFMISLGNF